MVLDFYQELRNWFAAHGLAFSKHRRSAPLGEASVGIGAYFFSQQEMSLWRSVQEAAGPKYQVFAKVPLSELVQRLRGPRAKSEDLPAALEHFLLDAIVCSRVSGEIIALVQTESGRKSVPMQFVEICRRSRIPLVVLRHTGRYLAEDVRRELQIAVYGKQSI